MAGRAVALLRPRLLIERWARSTSVLPVVLRHRTCRRLLRSAHRISRRSRRHLRQTRTALCRPPALLRSATHRSLLLPPLRRPISGSPRTRLLDPRRPQRLILPRPRTTRHLPRLRPTASLHETRLSRHHLRRSSHHTSRRLPHRSTTRATPLRRATLARTAKHRRASSSLPTHHRLSSSSTPRTAAGSTAHFVRRLPLGHTEPPRLSVVSLAIGSCKHHYSSLC